MDREPIEARTGQHCSVCGNPMTADSSLRHDCGGDCLMCMAEAGDPECVAAALRLQEQLAGAQQAQAAARLATPARISAGEADHAVAPRP